MEFTSSASKSMPLTVGDEKFVIAVLQSRHPAQGYRNAVRQCTGLMDHHTTNTLFHERHLNSPRNVTGASVHHGVTLGPGSTGISYSSSPDHDDLLKSLDENHCFQTLASYGDCEPCLV